ncbi:uncharacterized protein N7498_001896 [Penicillium cinerascens]|uniref:Myb-like domain-containing protein n=1 Tax=Penicillium cinerascens TaxID=70096 RepID=A0A9W9N954_9EURO|nr:uncharacterized protein N7498_001896 [Penicillium cinerascens]KAJ5215489.1 hypothetical protein N7498_001896 [Penicillium cinerascens]
MVTLNHQKFWQPTPNSPQRCSSVDTETRTIVITEQLNTSRESCEAGGYSPKNNVPVEEGRVMNSSSETGRLSRPVAPDAYPDDAPAADNYPGYPEEVALYPSSRVSSTASVTGLNGPGTTRVFDVFEDDHMQFTPSRRKRALGNPSNPSPKRRRYPASTTINAPKSRGRRMSQSEAESSSSYSEDDYADNHLVGLGNAIRYLKRFYSLSTVEAKFSDDLADADILKGNLAVIQLATETLQHAYGIIATSTLSIANPIRQATTVQARQITTREKWTPEDDRRLLDLKDSQKWPWGRIHEKFPGRTLNAVKQRHSGLSKQSKSPSSKENHSSFSGRRENCTQNVRRSQRLDRHHQLKNTRSDAWRHRRYTSRAEKHSGVSNAPRLDCIDPQLRSLSKF